MKRFPLLAATLVLFFTTTLASLGFAASDSLEIVANGKSRNLSLAQLKSRIPPVTVTVQDPVYKERVTYDAFPLAEVLKIGSADRASGDEIVFQAKDGYAPSAPLSLIQGKKGFLAFREHGTKSPWRKVQQGKEWISPAPFYLVWDEPDAKKRGEELPWPYQLARIEVVKFATKYEKLFPAGAAKDSKEYRGFLIFKSTCIRCHSVNLQGGDIGPELNIPKNVTEYWSEENLRALIRDASSFRAKSKMPAFPNLSGPELGEILAYLKAMKSRKDLSGVPPKN